MTGRHRMLRATVASALAAGLATAVSGCSFAPDPAAVDAQAAETFDGMVTALGEVEPSALRTVEVLPETELACDEAGYAQTSRVARGSTSVTAAAGTVGQIIEQLAETFDPQRWTPAENASAGERAWVSDEGVLASLSDVDPVLVVAVFTPCAADG